MELQYNAKYHFKIKSVTIGESLQSHKFPSVLQTVINYLRLDVSLFLKPKQMSKLGGFVLAVISLMPLQLPKAAGYMQE